MPKKINDNQLEDLIKTDPAICHGKACFKGTRIMVSSILELLEAGQSEEEILAGYPGLTRRHLQAALHLASRLLDTDQFIPYRAA